MEAVKGILEVVLLWIAMWFALFLHYAARQRAKMKLEERRKRDELGRKDHLN